MNETITVKDGQAAVTTTAVSGELSPKSSATDIITVVKTANGDQAAVKVVDLGGGGGGGGDFLPLSGGTLTGPLKINAGENSTPIVIDDYWKIEHTSNGFLTIKGGGHYNTVGIAFRGGAISPCLNKGLALGEKNLVWTAVYVQKLNNGADIAIPTEGGTMARIEDIDAAVGDISTALTAILGE